MKPSLEILSFPSGGEVRTLGALMDRGEALVPYRLSKSNGGKVIVVPCYLSSASLAVRAPAPGMTALELR